MNNEEGHIWFHADDYGVTPEQSERILDCYKQGVLNSISVLPNSPALVECRKLLDEADPKHQIRRVLHINLVEGRPAAGARSGEAAGRWTGNVFLFFCKAMVMELSAAWKEKGDT